METTTEERPAAIRMTWAEIKLAYPDQWVVLADLDDDPLSIDIRSAVVIGFGRTRRAADDMGGPMNGQRQARLFTGRLKSPRPW